MGCHYRYSRPRQKPVHRTTPTIGAAIHMIAALEMLPIPVSRARMSMITRHIRNAAFVVVSSFGAGSARPSFFRRGSGVKA